MPGPARDRMAGLPVPWHHRPAAALLAARGRLFPFAPVCLALGIAAYFALPAEPGRGGMALAALLAGAGLMLRLCAGAVWHPVGVALLLLAAGFGIAGLRAHTVAAPVLGFRYYGPIEGRIVHIDRSMSDLTRLTLDQVVLDTVAPARVPARVRIALMGDQRHIVPEPGLRVILTGHLLAPQGPVAPGGFDFRRLAWFNGLGAVGYANTPVLALAPADEGGADLLVHRARMAMSAWVRARIPGDAGAFAAAVMTGDRSGISRALDEEMRISNLSHILSISGMHMGMLAGFVFAALRYGLGAIPPLALRLPVKKIAAGVALVAAAAYLALSGRDVATERAFIMVAVMLVAVLFDRRAISMRSVAMAGLVVMLLRPESLTQPGFQMSFAATVGLVAAFEWLRTLPPGVRGRGWLWGAVALFVSSAVAGAASAPYAAIHFNRLAPYGLLANLLASPAMGLLVMPGAVLTAVLAPLGLAAPVLWMVEAGSRWVLFISAWVAGLEGAVSAVPAPPAAVMPLFSLGMIWLVLWRGWLRWAGGLAALLAFWLWAGAERPALLIAPDGALVGVMGPEGRALSKPRGAGFVAANWLEKDGDLAPQADAALRPGMVREKGAARFALAEWQGVHLSGKGAVDRLAGECQPGRLVILAAPAPEDWAAARLPQKADVARDGVYLPVPLQDIAQPGAGQTAAAPQEPALCVLIDQTRLARSGAIAVHLTDNGLRLTTVAARDGRRLWSQ